jgi:uncharacterized protein (TIGR01777 family)
MRVFVTGGTGLIGTPLIRRLCRRQDSVLLLTRRPAAARERVADTCTVVEGDPMREGPWMESIRDCDAVINLAGEGIFGHRWNEEFKTLLRDSRVKSTSNVVRAMAKQPQAPAGKSKILVNGSAIGYYGFHGDEEITEESPPGDDTLARMCVAWEDAAREAERHGIRVARVRTGVVLDKAGGALATMLPPFKMGAGGRVASGKQWLSWIHLHDIVGILLLALDNAGASGAINATAPRPVTNNEFTKSLGRALHRPTFLPVPGFALRLRFGQVAEILTTGQRVLPQRALALGYQFQFPEIDQALRHILNRPSPATS